MQFDMAYYIADSGDALDACLKYTADYRDFHIRACDYLDTIGGESYIVGHNGHIGAVGFPEGKIPEGFCKPRRGEDVSRPKKKSDWAEKLASVGKRPKADDYLEGIFKIPTDLSYETERGCGTTCFGNPFMKFGIYWFDHGGPFLIMCADVAKTLAKYRSEEGFKRFTSDISYGIPHGVRRILQEEWDLLVAQAKRKKEKEQANLEFYAAAQRAEEAAAVIPETVDAETQIALDALERIWRFSDADPQDHDFVKAAILRGNGK